MISYKPLFHTLIERGLKKEDLIKAGVASCSITNKLNKGESVTLTTVDKLCKYLNCKIEDIVEIV